jgi:hypothetical protein
MWTCVVIEIVILVCLARMGCVVHFVSNMVAGFIGITIFGVVVVGHNLFSVDIFVYALLGFLMGLGGRLLWLVARHPLEAIVALDNVAMENAVAKQLSPDGKDRYSYGNRRLAQEIVRKLTGRSD